MTTPHRTPPGRAGRLRLRRSLDVALRGADLLEEKLRILRAEHERWSRAEETALAAWQGRLRDAETWLLRGVLLGGEQALDAAAMTARGQAAVEWTTTMGVRHPSAVSYTAAVRAATEPAPGNTALAHAETAYRDAIRAAADLAAARAAARAFGEEALGTRRRVRALRRHWIPRLSAELAAVDLALEQAEHEDSVRRRWAGSVREQQPRPPATG